MANCLVIVESPAKAKTINKILGQDYIVRSSMGHIRDLPARSSGRSAPARKPSPALSPVEREKHRRQREYERLVRNMAVDPENGWRAHYEILPRKLKILNELKRLAGQVGTVYLATDLDREGEAIAWHLREAIGLNSVQYRRVIFSEITREAIRKAFEHPGELNMDRVHAQQARRFLDRVVGYLLSPLLWRKVARGLSAGRVQSVAVRMIVEREREIGAFVPEEYWTLIAHLKADPPFPAQVVKHKGSPFKPREKAEIDIAVNELEKAIYVVTDRARKPVKQYPYPPFITTSLQASASARLGFSVKKTMVVAQHLYEAGFITYMRTDSTQLSRGAIEACRQLIRHRFGPAYCPEKPIVYASKAGAQEAHEAIRPTDVDRTAEMLPELDRDHSRLYDLIWRQFVACQMPPAEFDTSTIDIVAGEYELRARGRVMRFDGWMRVLPPMQKKENGDIELPEVAVGDRLPLIRLESQQHFTRPPARYTEATLVKELEKRGIGRPSTYAPIISTIQERGYVELKQRRFYALKIGGLVTDRLVENFADLMNYGFTAQMEKNLDTIAQGEMDWRAVLDEFYAIFKVKLARAEVEMRDNPPLSVPEIACPSCGRPMMVRSARTGVFLSCSGYLEAEGERCKSTLNLITGDETIDEETEELRARRRCKKCGAAMDSYLIDATHKLHVCSNAPDCQEHEIEEGSFRIKGYDGPTLECDRCGAPMELKKGRFGKFFACTRYPSCRNTRKLMRDGQPAPPKAEPVPMPELRCEKSDAYFVLRDGAAGVFLAAHTFPRSRETKSPLVEDLARHRDELDPKFHYIADAPATDPDGNKSIVRFRRKQREQILVSEMDGKATGWVATYRGGAWEWSRAKK